MNFHLVHVIQNINSDKLKNVWLSSQEQKVSLKEQVLYYISHFKLHLSEIEELINKQ